MSQQHRGTLSFGLLLAALGGCVLVLLTSAMGANASPGTTINASSGSTTIGNTTTTNVSVTLAAPDAQLDAMHFTLTFDSSVASVSSWSLGSGWQDFGSVQNANSIEVIAIRLPAAVPCGSPCTMLTVTWEGESNGTSTLGQSGELVNTLAQEGLPITYEFNGGTIQVGPVSTPETPTETGTATETSTATTTTTSTSTTTTTATSTTTTTATSTTTTTTTATSTTTATGTASPTGTATGTATPTGTPTGTPTVIPGGPRPFILYLPEIARDGVQE